MDKSSQVEAALKDAIAHIVDTIQVQKRNQNSEEVLLEATRQLSELIDIISARLLEEIKDKSSTDQLDSLLKAVAVLRDQTLSAIDKWNASKMPILEHNFKALAELTLYEVNQLRLKTENKKIDLNLNGNELFELIVKNEEKKPFQVKRALHLRDSKLRMEIEQERKMKEYARQVQREKEMMKMMMERQKRELRDRREALEKKVMISERKMMELMSQREQRQCQLEEKRDMIQSLKCQIEKTMYQLKK